MNGKIRDVLLSHARLPAPVDALGDSDDLYAAGMTSYASINVMLGLEEAFDVEFPDRLLTRAAFSSIDAIGAAITELSALTPSE
ncbi:MAG: acyl carrier protein [Mycobacteriales bacterium]